MRYFVAAESTPIFLGWVRHFIDVANLTVYNITIDGQHAFDPGWVARPVVTHDNAIWIQTTGEGTGPLPWLNSFGITVTVHLI